MLSSAVQQFYSKPFQHHSNYFDTRLPAIVQLFVLY